MFPLKKNFTDYGSIYKHEEMNLYVHSVNGHFAKDSRGPKFELTELNLTPHIKKARKMKDELISKELAKLGFQVITVVIEKSLDDTKKIEG